MKTPEFYNEEARAEARAKEGRRKYAEKHPWLYKPRDWHRHNRRWATAMDILVILIAVVAYGSCIAKCTMNW